MSCSKTSKKLCDDGKCEMCCEKSFASHEKAQYWSKINKLSPRQVFKVSGDKFWFDCAKCSHTFDCTPAHIKYGCWCSYCSNQKLCGKPECKYCYEKSFASHEKSQYWSKLNKLSPIQIRKTTKTKRYLFDCGDCGHTFPGLLKSINTGGWCGYCSKPPKQLCDNSECKHCYEKSFASHEKSIYWSSKNELKPRDVFKISGKPYWFNCTCGHEIELQLDHIARNSWCGFCSKPPVKICDNSDCKHCYEKSFASHEKSIYWSSKNELNPRNVFKCSGKKYWFKCNSNHDFPCPLNDIYRNRWCPYCVNKTEQKLYDKLLPDYPQLNTQYKVEWCKNKTYLPYDFVLALDKIIIELDGLQHFEQVSNWQSPEDTHINDVYKIKCANENGYSVIRLLQTDVFYDTYDWLTELSENIEKIKLEQRFQNVYMCKDNEYAIFT
jgi:very-short-patch-repair endonuclease